MKGRCLIGARAFKSARRKGLAEFFFAIKSHCAVPIYALTSDFYFLKYGQNGTFI